MKKEKKLPIELLICECHSTDHQIILLHEYDEEFKEDENGNYVRDDNGQVIVTKKSPICYAHIHLNKDNFWGRLKYGIKYIFGYQSRYGAFDEFIFNPDDVPRLQKLIDHLNEQIINND
jgi:hypothetical protein